MSRSLTNRLSISAEVFNQGNLFVTFLERADPYIAVRDGAVIGLYHDWAGRFLVIESGGACRAEKLDVFVDDKPRHRLAPLQQECQQVHHAFRFSDGMFFPFVSQVGFSFENGDSYLEQRHRRG